MASYLVANAQPGAWSIVIGTSDVSVRNYAGYAAVSSPLALTVSYSPSVVLNGAAGVITASLAAGVEHPVQGAVVTSTLLAPDGTSTIVELSDQGNGHYAGSFTAPASAGLVPVLVQAAGELSGPAFERAQFFVLPVGSADIRLGNISEQAVDANSDSRYSRLDIGLDIEVGSPGHYVVSAQLRRDGQPLSVATTTTNVLQPGRHRVVLGFRGAVLDRPTASTAHIPLRMRLL